jgi:hypothetical protein
MNNMTVELNPEERQVDIALNLLAGKITSLEEIGIQLEKRLVRVLNKAPRIETISTAPPAPDNFVPLAMTLKDQSERIMRVIYQIDTIIRCLEI